MIPIYKWGIRKFVIVPIIMFIDKTHLDRQGSATLCSVSYTLSIFNDYTRKKIHAWRHLGFIPKDVVRAVIGNTHKQNKCLKLAKFLRSSASYSWAINYIPVEWPLSVAFWSCQAHPFPGNFVSHDYCLVVGAAADGTKAIADMVILAFFFLLRPGEYTFSSSKKDSAPFRL